MIWAIDVLENLRHVLSKMKGGSHKGGLFHYLLQTDSNLPYTALDSIHQEVLLRFLGDKNSGNSIGIRLEQIRIILGEMKRY